MKRETEPVARLKIAATGIIKDVTGRAVSSKEITAQQANTIVDAAVQIDDKDLLAEKINEIIPKQK